MPPEDSNLLVTSLSEAAVLPAFQLQPGQQTLSRKMCQRHFT